MQDLRAEPITRDNVLDACRIELRPGQDRYVAPVARSLAEAYAEPDHAWPRLIYAGPRLVGFVMGGFRPGDPLMASTIWRLAIAADAQRQGYGRFAVHAVATEARRRGHDILTTAYVLGPDSPEDFYLRLGFQPTGRSHASMHEAAINIDDLLRHDHPSPRHPAGERP